MYKHHTSYNPAPNPGVSGSPWMGNAPNKVGAQFYAMPQPNRSSSVDFRFVPSFVSPFGDRSGRNFRLNVLKPKMTSRSSTLLRSQTGEFQRPLLPNLSRCAYTPSPNRSFSSAQQSSSPLRHRSAQDRICRRNANSTPIESTSTDYLAPSATNCQTNYTFAPLDLSELGENFDQNGSMEDCLRSMDSSAVRRLAGL